MPAKKKKLIATLPIIDATCGCATRDANGGKHAVAVDADGKDRNLKRLRRIEEIGRAHV